MLLKASSHNAEISTEDEKASHINYAQYEFQANIFIDKSTHSKSKHTRVTRKEQSVSTRY